MDSAVRICLKLLLLALWSNSLQAYPAKTQLVDSYRNQQLPDIPGYIPVYIKHELPAYPFKSNPIKHRPPTYKDAPIRRTAIDHHHPKRENKKPSQEHQKPEQKTHHEHHKHKQHQAHQQAEKKSDNIKLNTDDKHHQCPHKVDQASEKNPVQQKHHCTPQKAEKESQTEATQTEERTKQDDGKSEVKRGANNENHQIDRRSHHQYEQRPYQHPKSEQALQKHIRPHHKVYKQQLGEMQRRQSQAYPVYYHKYETPALFLRNNKPKGTNNYYYE